MMKCPYCGGEQTALINVNEQPTYIMRTRGCNNPLCRKRFVTREVILNAKRVEARRIKVGEDSKV